MEQLPRSLESKFFWLISISPGHNMWKLLNKNDSWSSLPCYLLPTSQNLRTNLDKSLPAPTSVLRELECIHTWLQPAGSESDSREEETGIRKQRPDQTARNSQSFNRSLGYRLWLLWPQRASGPETALEGQRPSHTVEEGAERVRWPYPCFLLTFLCGEGKKTL